MLLLDTHRSRYNLANHGIFVVLLDDYVILCELQIGLLGRQKDQIPLLGGEFHDVSRFKTVGPAHNRQFRQILFFFSFLDNFQDFRGVFWRQGQLLFFYCINKLEKFEKILKKSFKNIQKKNMKKLELLFSIWI